jgi:hypothetical protein
MLLHLPAQLFASRQFLPASRSDRGLRDMVDAIRPVAGGPSTALMDWMGAAAMSKVEVSQPDVYTVVLAQDAARMLAALERVEPRKRPSALTYDLSEEAPICGGTSPPR